MSSASLVSKSAGKTKGISERDKWLVALRGARDAGEYPATVRQLAEKLHEEANKKALDLIAKRSSSPAVFMAAKDITAPLVFLEDLDILARSDALILFAAKTVRSKRAEKGVLAGDIKKFVTDSKVVKDLKPGFTAALQMRCDERSLPTQAADLIVIPQTSEEIVDRLLKVIRSQRNASADGCPVPERRLLELAGRDIPAKDAKEALKSAEFLENVFVCNVGTAALPSKTAYLHRGDLDAGLSKLTAHGIALATEKTEAAKPKKRKADTTSVACRQKTTLFDADEIAGALFKTAPKGTPKDKDPKAIFAAKIAEQASRRSLGADLAWLYVKGKHCFFRRKDVEPAGSIPERPSVQRPDDEPQRPPSPQQEKPAASFGPVFDAAFARVDARTGRRNLILVRELRTELPQFTRTQFDAGLRGLRLANLYSMESSHGASVRLSAEDRQAGIQEGSSLLVYVSRK